VVTVWTVGSRGRWATTPGTTGTRVNDQSAVLASGRLPLAPLATACDHVRREDHVEIPSQRAPLSLDELRARRAAILGLAQRHGAHDVRIFGFVARGDATRGSDVDFLVTMEAGRSLFDLGGLLMDLRELLGTPVDVVTPASLRERVRARVLREAAPL
jgi:uncharacterized protein